MNQVAKIKHIWIHPWYVKSTHNWDFALAQLRDPFNYTDVIMPACLPPSDSYNVGGDEWVVVTGYGATENWSFFLFSSNFRSFDAIFTLHIFCYSWNWRRYSIEASSRSYAKLSTRPHSSFSLLLSFR